jgi:hypothetical protein
MLEQFGNVAGGEIAQLTILGPSPDILVGVAVRSMCREVLDHHVGLGFYTFRGVWRADGGTSCG